MLRALVACIVAAGCASQPTPAKPCATVAAKKPFKMRMYSFVLLKRGPAWTAEQTDESKRLFEGHMANIKAMARSGKLVLAGPLEADDADKTAYAGIFIFDAGPAELKTLLAADPAIAAGRLTPEIREWYGPVGLTYDGRDQALRE